MSEDKFPSRAASVTLLLAAGVAALSLAAQATASWQHAAATASPLEARLGCRCNWVAVTLLNGQIYYGQLTDANAAGVSLENVYYVQSFANPATQQPDNRVVNRAKADWHGPKWMSIPADKLLMVEGVSAESRLGQLIAQDQRQQPAASAAAK